MKSENEMTLEFPSKSANESFARAAVACFAAQLDPNMEELNDIKTAVSEAVTNAIVHGYNNNPDSEVVIKAETDHNSITVEIIDYGVGIPDVAEAVKPFYTSRPNEERSGMGFTIMKSFMDEFDLKSRTGLTSVKMKKIIKEV